MDYSGLLSNASIQAVHQTKRYERRPGERGEWVYGLLIIRTDSPENEDGNVHEDLKDLLEEDARNGDEIDFIDFQFIR